MTKTILTPKNTWDNTLTSTQIEMLEIDAEWTDRNMNYRVPVYSDSCKWVYCERSTKQEIERFCRNNSLPKENIESRN